MVDRVRATWNGFPGSPGLSTFYVTSGAAAQAPIRAFFASIAAFLPVDVSISVQTAGDTVDPVTSQISGGWAGTTQAPVQGTSNDGYAAPAGFLVRWETSQVRAGRRVRGRTFLVPSSASSFQQDGSITEGAKAAANAAATALITALGTDLFVLQRQRDATPLWTDIHGRVHPAKPSRAGEAIPVTAGSVPDRTVVLRSRRD